MTRDSTENTPQASSGVRLQEAAGEPLHASNSHTCCSCGNCRTRHCAKTQQNCTKPILLSSPRGSLSCVIVEQVLIGAALFSLYKDQVFHTHDSDTYLCTARLF